MIDLSIMTPDRVESRTGTLKFTDGMPSQATLDKIYDHLDFTHPFEAFVNAIQDVNTHAIHRGYLDAGLKDSKVIPFSERGPDSMLALPSKVLKLQRPE